MLINEGDEISIDGSTGEVFLGAMPVVPSPVETYIESGLDAALDGADDETTALVKAVDRLLTHADVRRRLAIRANADTAEDAARARSLGAQGIGLCRTEHMFLGDRRSLIERVILAGTADERDAALDALLPLQRKDFTELLDAMDGLPVNIRLLDPPLHEFLPDRTELAGQGRRGRGQRARPATRSTPTGSCWPRWSGCTNRTRCWACAACGSGCSPRACSRCRCGRSPRRPAPRCWPARTRRSRSWSRWSGSVMELHLVRDEAEAILAEVAAAKGVSS